MFTTFRRPLRHQRRLICFPFAGGGESHFRDWAGRIPDADVVAARLAGRESRFAEPAQNDFSALLDELVGAIEPFLGAQNTLFGHSFGGLLAFEVARNLETRGHGPALVIISGCDAPRTIVSAPKPQDLSDDVLLAGLAAHSAVPSEMVESRELMGLVLPAFRADLRAKASYRIDPAARPLGRPVRLYYGTEEAFDPEQAREGWAEVVSGTITMSGFPGGHFFVNSARQDVLDTISKDMARARL
ncbi:thioesterase II family protein [Streptomyces sp. DSM 40750]|uniref:thioesterase II family protein n=1 Tax=Streptomyces sp. DSM 40750 TaxID=2801030 RepID=UPI00214B1E7D|nr:alpha/beta fold hydrolase [Streptomyces sp. DSM 40750]UUU25951.1 thioesterase domain-containing protein [Streptomyces sp. DSM 40750]